MRKAFLIFAGVLLLLIVASCSVSPEQALENIQNPKIEVKTRIKIPVVATRVDTGEIFESYAEEFLSSSLGVDIEE
jgi:hypothetical protein